jgi:hypothetical protein
MRASCQNPAETAVQAWPEPNRRRGPSTLRGAAQYRKRSVMMGVKHMELNRKPQNPMRRFLPAIPATRHKIRYRSRSARMSIGV